jgi:oligogalacturonide lyase
MKGDLFPSEIRERRDSQTGVLIRQLTAYKGHSHHFYFTNPGWWDGGRRLLFGSDRGNCTDLYSLELASGAVTQLTEHGPHTDVELLFSCVNPTRPEAYFVRERQVWSLNLQTLAERPIFQVAPGFKLNLLNCAVDGQYIYTGIFEDLSAKFQVDLLHGYVGFKEYFLARPISRIMRIPVDGSRPEGDIVREEQAWIGHVNTSPRHAHLLTFCHEGPWDLVGQRIWGLDAATGRAWKIRPANNAKDKFGHEYWLADGEHVGYHGNVGGKEIFGVAKWDSSEVRESAMPTHSQHYHSNTAEAIVGDGTGSKVPYILIWSWTGKHISEPRILCTHRGSRHVQQLHVHPRFSPDGRHVLYTADPAGYGQLHLAEVPPLENLPVWREGMAPGVA